MKAYISVDMEGIGGVSHPDPTDPKDVRYPVSVDLMVGETNAAIEGAVAAGATDVELDLDTGRRGRRGRSTMAALADAVPYAGGVHVVNNGAAALALVTCALAPGREIVVARGELVEIGAYMNGANPDADQALARMPRIEAFLQQDMDDPTDTATTWQRLNGLLSS